MQEINWRLVSKSAAWIIAIAALVSIYSFASRRQSDMVCKSIRIEMLDSEHFVSGAQIWHELNTRHLINKKINSLEIDSLETLFKGNAFIAKANLSVDLSGILTVKIGQKHPFILVTNAVGQRYFIDRQGNKMPYSSADTSKFYQVKGHIAEGFAKADTLHTSILKNILFLSNYVENSSLNKSKYRFFGIADNDQMQIIPARQPFTILLGDTSNLEEKFSKLELIYSTVLPREGTNKYSDINLQYTGQVVCTLKTAPTLTNQQINTQQALNLMPAGNKQNKINPSLSYGK